MLEDTTLLIAVERQRAPHTQARQRSVAGAPPDDGRLLRVVATVRPMTAADANAVLQLDAEEVASGDTTFHATAPG